MTTLKIKADKVMKGEGVTICCFMGNNSEKTIAELLPISRLKVLRSEAPRPKGGASNC